MHRRLLPPADQHLCWFGDVVFSVPVSHTPLWLRQQRRMFALYLFGNFFLAVGGEVGP